MIKSTASLSIEEGYSVKGIYKNETKCKTAFVPYIIIITMLNF